MDQAECKADRSGGGLTAAEGVPSTEARATCDGVREASAIQDVTLGFWRACQSVFD